MPLIEPSLPVHGPALRRFAARLRTGDPHDRALLLNLQEEDRIPDDKRRAFQEALVSSRKRSWKQRFWEAAPIAERALPVPTPRPSEIAGPWWNHVALGALEKYRYVSPALHRVSRPPRRLPLARPISRPEKGSDRSFWITPTTSPSADDIRDRLGLCLIVRGDILYRIRIEIDAVPDRLLYVPTAIDAGFYPAWRHPGANHTTICGMTRHLGTDVTCERELLALPDDSDALAAEHIGKVGTDPPGGYLRARGLI